MCKQSEIKKLIECFSSTGRCLATSSKADPHHRQQWLAKTKTISTYVSPFWLISFNFFFLFFFSCWARYHMTLLWFRSAISLYCFHFPPLYCFHFPDYPQDHFLGTRAGPEWESEKALIVCKDWSAMGKIQVCTKIASHKRQQRTLQAAVLRVNFISARPSTNRETWVCPLWQSCLMESRLRKLLMYTLGNAFSEKEEGLLVLHIKNIFHSLPGGKQWEGINIFYLKMFSVRGTEKCGMWQKVNPGFCCCHHNRSESLPFTNRL